MTIAHSLAKELKQAGFPQTGKGESCRRLEDHDIVKFISIEKCEKEEDVYYPTTEELLAWCVSRILHNKCQKQEDHQI